LAHPGIAQEPEPQEEYELEHHPSPRQYVRIGVILAVVTAGEVAIYYVDSMRDIIVPFLIAFALIKFFLVLTWFMHLRFDSRVFSRLFVSGLVLAGAVYLIVLVIFFARGGAAPLVTTGG
jgi:cytochrome c oxidase subunit IV